MVDKRNEDMELPYPHYRCAACEADLPPTEARLSVTCAEHQPVDQEFGHVIRPATNGDVRQIEEICDRVWGETEIDIFGRTFDVLECENIIAVVDDALAGLISLSLDRGDLAIVVLSVYPQYQGSGIGSELVEAAVKRAEEIGVPLLKVSATNDDLSALYFYQRKGFVIYDVATGVMVDHHGSAEPGFAGIPVRDEIRLRRTVPSG